MAVNRAGARAKGNKAENEVRDLLRARFGGHISRGRLEGADDRGDVVGLPRLVNQVKNYDDIGRALRDGLSDAAIQKENAGADWGAVWVRHRGGRYTVTLTAEDFLNLYEAATR